MVWVLPFTWRLYWGSHFVDAHPTRFGDDHARDGFKGGSGGSGGAENQIGTGKAWRYLLGGRFDGRASADAADGRQAFPAQGAHQVASYHGCRRSAGTAVEAVHVEFRLSAPGLGVAVLHSRE